MYIYIIQRGHAHAWLPNPSCRHAHRKKACGRLKRAAKKPAADDAAPPSIATLAARLLREDLERLLVQGVAGGAVSRREVLSCLPEAKQSAVPRPAPVISGGSSRTGTGRFDEVGPQDSPTLLGPPLYPSHSLTTSDPLARLTTRSSSR